MLSLEMRKQRSREGVIFPGHIQAASNVLFLPPFSVPHAIPTLPLAPRSRDFTSSSLCISNTQISGNSEATHLLGTFQMTKQNPSISTHDVSESTSLLTLEGGVPSRISSPPTRALSPAWNLWPLRDEARKVKCFPFQFSIVGKRYWGMGGEEKIRVRLFSMLYKVSFVFQNHLPIPFNITLLSCLPCCAYPIPPGMIFPRISPDKLLFILRNPVQIALPF